MKLIAAIRFVLQVGGAIAIVSTALSFPAVQDFVFGIVLPFLGFAALAGSILLYGVYCVREEESEEERKRAAKRCVRDEESTARQEEYFHARGLCLNCKPRLEGKYLEALQAAARYDAERILAAYSGVAMTLP